MDERGGELALLSPVRQISSGVVRFIFQSVGPNLLHSLYSREIGAKGAGGPQTARACQGSQQIAECAMCGGYVGKELGLTVELATPARYIGKGGRGAGSARGEAQVQRRRKLRCSCRHQRGIGFDPLHNFL